MLLWKIYKALNCLDKVEPASRLNFFQFCLIVNDMRRNKAHKFEYIGAFGRILCSFISLVPFIIASFLMMFLFLCLYKNVYRPKNDVSGFIGIVITILSFTGIFSIPKFRSYFQYLYNALLHILYSRVTAKKVTNFYRLGIKSQNNVISHLIGEISKGDSHIFSINGQPSSGKTTIAVLFVDAIGRDKNLSKIFAKWKDNICYVDLSINGDLDYLLTTLIDGVCLCCFAFLIRG